MDGGYYYFQCCIEVCWVVLSCCCFKLYSVVFLFVSGVVPVPKMPSFWIVCCCLFSSISLSSSGSFLSSFTRIFFLTHHSAEWTHHNFWGFYSQYLDFQKGMICVFCRYCTVGKIPNYL